MAIETQWVDVRRTWKKIPNTLTNTMVMYTLNMSLKLEQNLEL
jgi:hypothetical protein